MSTDNPKTILLDALRQRDLRFFSQILTRERVMCAAVACGRAIGHNPLNLFNLSWLAIASAWHTSKSFGDVLLLFFRLYNDIQVGESYPPADHPTPHQPDPLAIITEEAFTLARDNVPALFWNFLLAILIDDFERLYPDLVCHKRFRVLALDGTCLSMQNRKTLIKHFGTASNGRGRKVPRARMVCLLLPFTRMIAGYELGSYTDSEHTLGRHLLERTLRKDDLVLMDKGFWSYGLFWQIQNKGAFFATRLKARIGMTKIKDLGLDDELVTHSPKDWRKSWRKKGLKKEITLRVIRYQLPGFQASAIVTNVLDPREISREEWIRLVEVDRTGRVIVAAGLYHRRWEIETSYREIKCDQGLEGGLRSRKPKGIRYEVAGHLLLYVLIRWKIVEAAKAAGIEDPLRVSFTATLNILEGMMWAAWIQEEEVVDKVLLPRLLMRMVEHLVSVRPNRHYPRLRDDKPKKKKKKKPKAVPTENTTQ